MDASDNPNNADAMYVGLPKVSPTTDQISPDQMVPLAMQSERTGEKVDSAVPTVASCP